MFLNDKSAYSAADTVAAPAASERQSATLTQSVYAQLRADILNGRMRPGEKIRAEAVRKRFNTASSPVREALNRLLSEGFVALEQQKGFRVAPVSIEELKELVKTRCWIDGLAIRESIERSDTTWEENLVLALHRLSRTHRGESGQAEKKICRSEKMTGSLTRVRRICLTAKEWDDLRLRTKHSFEDRVNGASGGLETKPQPGSGG